MAFQGHMLSNSLITGQYATILMCGGGRAAPKSLRMPMILLQMAALVASGGRTALICGSVIAIWSLSRWILSMLTGARLSRLEAAAYCIAPLLAAVIMLVMVEAGFFSVVIDRFVDDGGSAATRRQMFDIFSYIPPGELLFSPDVELVDSVRSMMGLELGIENPILRLAVYQGFLATAALTLGVALFMAKAIRPLQGRVAPSFVYFIVMLMSFESLGSKTTLLGKFAILMLVMFRPAQRSGLADRAAPMIAQGPWTESAR